MVVYVVVLALPNGNESVVREYKTEVAAKRAVARYRGNGRYYYFRQERP
jgi:hypothetical protein